MIQMVSFIEKELAGITRSPFANTSRVSFSFYKRLFKIE